MIEISILFIFELILILPNSILSQLQRMLKAHQNYYFHCININ